jgi:hypothetical protein
MHFKLLLKSIAASVLCSSMLAGCGGDDSSSTDNNTNTDTKITLKISGVVNDTNGIALANAKVEVSQSGSIINTTTTDASGKISETSLDVKKDNDVVIIASKDSYLKQVQTLGKFSSAGNTNFHLHLLKPTSSSVVSLDGSGNAKINVGAATVEFAKDSFVDSTGKTVTGNIDVNLTVLDPNKSPNSFPGNPNIKLSTGEDGYMASLGMVDFIFNQNGQKLQLASGKQAEITIPMFGGYNDKGEPINVGDKVPFWTMNEKTGNWTQEGEGTVIADASSASGLSVKGSVSHFSWWNLDYPIKLVYKTVEVYDTSCNNLYKDGVLVTATFKQAVPDSYIFGLTTRSGATYITGGSKSVGFPVGFNASITGSYTVDNKYEIKPQDFTWDTINSSSVIKLCLQTIKPTLTLYPENEVIIPIGNSYYFYYSLKGVSSKDVKWYVDGIEGGNSSVGTISENGVYTTTGLTAGVHTIKAVSVENANAFDEVTVNLVDNLVLENSVIVNGEDIFADIVNIAQTPKLAKVTKSSNSVKISEYPYNGVRSSTLIKGQTNNLIPHLNGTKLPANAVIISDIACNYYTSNETPVNDCAKFGVSKVNNKVNIAQNIMSDINGFTTNQIETIELARNASIQISAYLASNPSITTVQNFKLDDLHKLYLNTNSTNYMNGTTNVTYNLQRFYAHDFNSKLGSEDFKVYCVKNGVMCPDAIESKRPRITVRKGDRQIDVLSPTFADFDNTETYYLTGIVNNNVDGVHSVLVAKLYCYATNSDTQMVCIPENAGYENYSTSNDFSKINKGLELPKSKLGLTAFDRLS